MNRREWLKCFSVLAMGAVAAPSLLATFDAHAAAQRPGYAPKFFNAPQNQLVTSVVDIILPRSDTPGAVDAGVPAFIDQMFTSVYTHEEQQRYLASLAAFDRAGGKPYLQLDEKQRKALVSKLHEQALSEPAGQHEGLGGQLRPDDQETRHAGLLHVRARLHAGVAIFRRARRLSCRRAAGPGRQRSGMGGGNGIDALIHGTNAIARYARMKTLKGPAIFLAQYAGNEAPFNTLPSIAAWAASMGFAGVQIPSNDRRLFDLEQAAASKTYCDDVAGTLAEHGLVVTELSTHLQGQLVASHPAYDRSVRWFCAASLARQHAGTAGMGG